MILINITLQSFMYMSKYYTEIKFKTIHIYIYMKEWNKVEGIDKNLILRPTQERQQ